MQRGSAFLVGCALASAGCFDDIATSFEPGIEPLEANEAPQPSRAGALVTTSGEEVEYVWVHGRGFIDAPRDAVWAAAKEPERVVNYCQSDGHTIVTGVEPDYELSFKVSYIVETAFADIEWDELWRYGSTPTTRGGPDFAIVRYQKTFGSDAITLLEGSIQILETDDPDRTEVQFVEHLDSIGGGIEEMTEQMNQRFAELQAGVSGSAHPSCPE